MQLKQGTHLQGGKYRIEKVLGQGGFGITYLAIQTGLDRKIAVKEFFMKELCERNESTSYVTLGTQGSKETVSRFREKFLKEARNIAMLNHPNIVRVIDIFEENGTAYYVMEFAENGSLSDKVKKEGCLSEPLATRYIKQVADALNYIHGRKMNHLDVKPGNIMLNGNDDAILIDFGLSKQYDETTGKQTSTTPVGISEGYAPMELYMQGGVGEFSPSTDIYSLGATFYKLLTGVTPPNASYINNVGLPTDKLKNRGVSQNTIDVINKAMEGRKRDRIKDINSFVKGLACETSSEIPLPIPNVIDGNDDVTVLVPRTQDCEIVEVNNTSHFPEVTFVVNLIKSTTCSEGGKIIIRDETVSFVPHAFNVSFFSEQERTICIKDIIGYKKGWLAFFTIFVKNREPYKLSTYKKNTIIEELEKRRDYYFQRKNMSTPPLSK